MRNNAPILFRRATRAALTGLAVLVGGVGAAVAQGDDSYRPSESAAPAEDAYRPSGNGAGGDTFQPPSGETYEPYRPLDGSRRRTQDGGPARIPERTQDRGDSGGYGEPYSPPQGGRAGREERYENIPDDDGPPRGDDGSTYSQSEIVRAGHGFFGSVSGGLASAIEWAFQKAGRPNGYILGQDAGGALVAGLRYGEGRLHTKDAGEHKVFWQGPTIGYDAGAEGSKVMTLVYNLRDPADIYARFGGVQGAAYLVGGVSVQLQKAGDVTLAPIRAGVGLRLGANVGYLKYTRNPTWNPF